MITTALNRDPDAWNSKVTFNEKIESYHVESTGATLTADSSISLIYKYCGKLPRDEYDIFPTDKSNKWKISWVIIFF